MSAPMTAANASVTEQLQGITDYFQANGPQHIRTVLAKSISEITSSFKQKDAIQNGSVLPAFELPSATGSPVRSTELLAKGPLLITFYRGVWCPYCNVALMGLQKHLDAFKAKGVTLVAVSPELPDTSISTVEKKGLQFEVLSDVDNEYARKLGIVWKMPNYLRPIFDEFGHDLKKGNGNDEFEVPVPATFYVDGSGIVKQSYIEPDYTKRLDPELALKWIE